MVLHLKNTIIIILNFTYFYKYRALYECLFQPKWCYVIFLLQIVKTEEVISFVNFLSKLLHRYRNFLRKKEV